MHSLTTHFVLGYHGCLREQGETFLQGESFKWSENNYDWLGSGVYFWESDPERAYEWAFQKCIREKREISDAFVVGAVLELGFCLDMRTLIATHEVRKAYKELTLILGEDEFPQNFGGKDKLIRKLDKKVFDQLHKSRENLNAPPIDSIRSIFTEGQEIYPGAGFLEKTHVQICLRNINLIKGTFRVNLRGLDEYFKKEYKV